MPSRVVYLEVEGAYYTHLLTRTNRRVQGTPDWDAHIPLPDMAGSVASRSITTPATELI